MDQNVDHAIQTQQKFEFYFLALVFTVLGLCIQTSQFSSEIQSVVEIGAWVCLFLSGIAGLSRMEWIPVLYEHYSRLTTEKSFAREAKGGRSVIGESGEHLSDEEVRQYIGRAEERIEERSELMKGIEQRGKIKYLLHKWLFVVALGLLVISRAWNLWCSAGSRY